MKYKIKVGDRQFIVDAKDEAKAVKKLKDAQARKVNDAIGEGSCEPIIMDYAKEAQQLLDAYSKTKKEDQNKKLFTDMIKRLETRILEEEKNINKFDSHWIAHKREMLENLRNAKVILTQGRIKFIINDSASVRDNDYVINAGRSWETLEPVGSAKTKEEAISKAKAYNTKYVEVVYSPLDYSEDKVVWRNKTKEKDSAIKDYRQVDVPHIASYGWLIERDLVRDCYWEAVEDLAGKLKTEQDYRREIPKLAKQKFENYIKQVKAEFEKLISAGRSSTSDYDKWAPEQAKAIMNKQESK